MRYLSIGKKIILEIVTTLLLLKGSRVIAVIFWGFIVFLVWAAQFNLDRVVRAQGKVVASSRVQVVQAVDGGVLAELAVREGDRVVKGQLLARFDDARLRAGAQEIRAKVMSQQARVARLRSEIGEKPLTFPDSFEITDSVQAIERALYKRRMQSLKDDLENFTAAIRLVEEEVAIARKLKKTGDIGRAEVIRLDKNLNEARSKYNARRNQFFEEASAELVKSEDELAQSLQVLANRERQLKDSVLRAPVSGIVKNINVTTLGGVLKSGEELLQIVPTGDELMLEAKVLPADIAELKLGLPVTIRFDAYDSSIYGAVDGVLSYISADTIREQKARGEETFYVVYVKAVGDTPIRTSTQKTIDLLPGMNAQVDIKLGQRSVLSYMLKPITKTIEQSFGER
jgi:adhesin transport system membrane fusion protein